MAQWWWSSSSAGGPVLQWVRALVLGAMAIMMLHHFEGGGPTIPSIATITPVGTNTLPAVTAVTLPSYSEAEAEAETEAEAGAVNTGVAAAAVGGGGGGGGSGDTGGSANRTRTTPLTAPTTPTTPTALDENSRRAQSIPGLSLEFRRYLY